MSRLKKCKKYKQEILSMTHSLMRAKGYTFIKAYGLASKHFLDKEK